MKLSLVAIGISLILLSVFLHTTRQVPCEAYIGRSAAFRIHSRNVGAGYKITVYPPAGYAPRSSEKYPAIYQLSGNYLGKPAAEIISSLSRCGGQTPAAIVVSIGYDFNEWETPENRDFTYPPPGQLATAAGDPRGGAVKFLRFLSEELVPWVDAHYNTIPAPHSRILSGDTLAGFFSLFAMLKNGSETGVSPFGRYLAALPFNGYEDNLNYLLGMEAEYDLRKPAAFPAALYLTLPDRSDTLRQTTWEIIHRRLASWKFDQFHFKCHRLAAGGRNRDIFHSYAEGFRHLLQLPVPQSQPTKPVNVDL